MKKWLRRLRGALGLGLMWGAAGGFAGGLIELIWNLWPGFPLGPAVDIWPAALAIPGFLGGTAFALVLGIAERRRGFHELSLKRVAAWGALGGVLVSLVPAAMVMVGLASTSIPLWQMTAGLAGPLALGGAAAASGTLALARVADEPEPLAPGERSERIEG